MAFFKTLGLMALASGLLHGQAPVEDPVMKVRAQRAQAQGINEGDLPPVPRSIIEPPPLPPPEMHTRDLNRSRGRVARVALRKGARKGKLSKGGTHRPKAVVKRTKKKARR